MTTIKISLSDGTDETIEKDSLDAALAAAREAILNAHAAAAEVDDIEVVSDGKQLQYACEWDVKLVPQLG